MPNKPNTLGKQMTLWESDDRPWFDQRPECDERELSRCLERCWLGAGCFHWARPVLRGFGSATRQGNNLGNTTGEIRGQQGKQTVS